MEAVFYIIAKVISLMLRAISLAMFSRVVMELMSRMTSHDVQGNKFFVFCYTVTEVFVTPVQIPVRKVQPFPGYTY